MIRIRINIKKSTDQPADITLKVSEIFEAHFIGCIKECTSLDIDFLKSERELCFDMDTGDKMVMYSMTLSGDKYEEFNAFFKKFHMASLHAINNNLN